MSEVEQLRDLLRRLYEAAWNYRHAVDPAKEEAALDSVGIEIAKAGVLHAEPQSRPLTPDELKAGIVRENPDE